MAKTLFFFLHHWLILFNSRNYAWIFNATAGIPVPTDILTKGAKGEMETHPVTLEAKISRCKVKKNLFVLLTYHFILVYFFNYVIPNFIYCFQSKFLIHFFSLRQSYIRLVLLHNINSNIFSSLLAANNRKNIKSTWSMWYFRFFNFLYLIHLIQ